MTSPEIAAYIGAAAWLPIVATWLYRTFAVPKVTIVSGEVPEIGFSTFGPIVNIRIAVTSSRKSVIIDSLSLVLSHEDGSNRTFHWAGMSEDVSQIIDSAGNRQRIEKEQTAIAFNVGVESLLEKFVRFQDRSFHERIKPYLDPFFEKIHFDAKQRIIAAEELIISREFSEIERAWEREFTWKPGTYYGQFLIGSPSRVSLNESKFKFSLNDTDIEILKSNLHTNREYNFAIFKCAENGSPQPPFQWNWRYPRISKIQS